MATLTLTATGAVVVPGLSGATASATEPRPTSNPAPRTATAHAAPRQHVAEAGVELWSAEIAAVAAQARMDARERASRAAQRQETALRKKKTLAAAHRWVMPVEDYRFSSPFGARWGRLHAGDDFAAPIGTRIGSISKGTVTFAGRQSGYGNKVEVRHWDGTVSWYGHMSSISVTVGDPVEPGDTLGEVGNTGHSTGPHLHLEIHPDGGGPVNPKPWLARHGLHV